jgi:hypothetical protein
MGCARTTGVLAARRAGALVSAAPGGHCWVVARTSGRRQERRLEKWQTVLAAAVAAVAAIVVAVIQSRGGGGSDGNGGSDGDDDEAAYRVDISSIALISATPPQLVRILGTANGLSSDDQIYVVARPDDSGDGEPGSGPDEPHPAEPRSSAGATPWIASDPAQRSDGGAWRVDFRLPADAVLPLSFVAVIYPTGTSLDPGDGAPPKATDIPERLERTGPGGLPESETFVGP